MGAPHVSFEFFTPKTLEAEASLWKTVNGGVDTIPLRAIRSRDDGFDWFIGFGNSTSR